MGSLGINIELINMCSFSWEFKFKSGIVPIRQFEINFDHVTNIVVTDLAGTFS
jgi:hypothetical protein